MHKVDVRFLSLLSMKHKANSLAIRKVTNTCRRSNETITSKIDPGPMALPTDEVETSKAEKFPL